MKEKHLYYPYFIDNHWCVYHGGPISFESFDEAEKYCAMLRFERIGKKSR